MKLARFRGRPGDEGSTQIIMLMACVCAVALTVMIVPLAQANDQRTRAQTGADAAAIGAVVPLRDEAIRIVQTLGQDPNDIGLWAVASDFQAAADKLVFHGSAEEYARRNNAVLTKKTHPSGDMGRTMKVWVRSDDCKLKTEEELTAKDRTDLATNQNLCTDASGKKGIAKSYGTASAIAELRLPKCDTIFYPGPTPDGLNTVKELRCGGQLVWTNQGYVAPRSLLIKLFKIRLVAKEGEEYEGRKAMPGGEGFSQTLPDASMCSEGGPMGPDMITPRMRCVKRLVEEKFPPLPGGIGCYRANGGIPGGGEHPLGRACDFMSNNNTELGYAIANWAHANATKLGIMYIIFRQHIYSPQRHAEGWRPMEDRGSPTANHMDHPHISVL